MSRFYEGLRDVQLDVPVCHCGRCGLEIYCYDSVAPINGELVHEECMELEEQDDFATAPACSFYEEAC